MIQGELRTVKEFRKRRVELEAELARLKESLTDSEQDQQRTLQALEERFFEEKVSSKPLPTVVMATECVSR